MKAKLMGKISTGLLAILIFLIFQAYVEAGCYPTTPHDESETVLEQTYDFRDCEFGQAEIQYCPHPLLERTYVCRQWCCDPRCDPPWCARWCTDGCNPEDVSEEWVCGISYNGGWTTGSNSTLDAGGWYCPACRALSEMYEPDPLSLGFNALSIQDGNSFLRSGETTDLTFSAYIPACVNRIPMLNLKVELKNESNEVESHEYGIYTKHNTLDYDIIGENRGILEYFDIPEQEEFRKTYTLNGTLKGYKPWAWRKRFVQVVEKIVESRPSPWNVLSGFPEGVEPVKIGDLYFSKDFLAGIGIEPEISIECNETYTFTRPCSIDVISLDRLDGYDTCNATDLQSYYSDNGLTPELENIIRDSCDVSGEVSIESLDINPSPEEELDGMINETNVNVTLYFDMNNTEFYEYATNTSNYDEVFSTLYSNGVITLEELKDIVMNHIQENFVISGCDEYNPIWELNTINNLTIPQLYEDNQSVDINFNISVNWTTDIIANSSITLNFTYDCDQVWAWGSLANLSGENLSECLYNWDNCLLANHGNSHYEAADCGYGPWEGTPTLEDLEDIRTDAGFGEENQTQVVTVYRSCEMGEKWADLTRIYICNGSEIIEENYTFDADEGEQYWVWKCGYDPSEDEKDFVKKMDVGTIIELDGTYYICLETSSYEWVEDQPPNTSIISPEEGSWHNRNFSVYIQDEDIGLNIDKCYYRVLSNEIETRGWIERDCNSSVNLTVGLDKDCRDEGLKKCRIEAYANDSVNQVGEIKSKNFSIDWTNPNISITAKDQDGNPIFGPADPSNVTRVNITLKAIDGISGIESNLIKYWITKVGETSYDGEEECGPALPNENSECSIEIDYENDMIIKYQGIAKDLANNINATPGENIYQFITAHPLANFMSSSLYLTIGRTELVSVYVRNMQISRDNITLRLEDYEYAKFLSNDGRELKIELISGEEKEIWVRIGSSETGEYELKLYVYSEINPELKDYDKLDIRVGYPAEFSGLGDLGIIIIIFLSSLIIFRIKEK